MKYSRFTVSRVSGIVAALGVLLLMAVSFLQLAPPAAGAEGALITPNPVTEINFMKSPNGGVGVRHTVDVKFELPDPTNYPNKDDYFEIGLPAEMQAEGGGVTLTLNGQEAGSCVMRTTVVRCTFTDYFELNPTIVDVEGGFSFAVYVTTPTTEPKEVVWDLGDDYLHTNMPAMPGRNVTGDTSGFRQSRF